MGIQKEAVQIGPQQQIQAERPILGSVDALRRRIRVDGWEEAAKDTGFVLILGAFGFLVGGPFGAVGFGTIGVAARAASR